MVGCRGDRGLYDGRNVSGVSKHVAGGRRDRGLHDGRNVSGARM